MSPNSVHAPISSTLTAEFLGHVIKSQSATFILHWNVNFHRLRLTLEYPGWKKLRQLRLYSQIGKTIISSFDVKGFEPISHVFYLLQ